MTLTTPDPARRNERSHRAILTAATDLIVEEGYERVSIESIARRAGVGKQTIYRWWPSKAAVALEALNASFSTVIGFPDTGDVEADLRTQLIGMNHSLATTAAGALSRALIAAAQSDPAISRAHIEQIIDPATEECCARLARAQEAGQIRSDIDLETAIDVLYGSIVRRLMLAHRPLAPEYVDQALDIVFGGLRPD
jgi:AcrR family transcriptional regulator